MTFNSYIFILLFLPLTVLGYYIILNFKLYRLATLFLFIASLLFYGYMNPPLIIFILINIFVNYIFFKGIRLCCIKPLYKYKKLILGVGIIFNVGVLLYYKYCNFFIENLNLLSSFDFTLRNIILPLGISFITFQQIAFLVDSYRNEIYDCNLLDYALFISYFPHVVSGPIILHKEFFPELSKEKMKMNWDFFAKGLYMFAMGLGKKVLIADLFGEVANWGYANISVLNSTSALFVTIAYSIQIYFDFSGYSDMAIGISRMLQIDLPINFNSPYKAKTIVEFWDRWHMTLTRFLTRYVYIPLGGNRNGMFRTYLNIMFVFIISGLWHGANWTFVLWGVLHGLFMVFTRYFKILFDKIPRTINIIITFLFVNFTWVLFRSESLGTSIQMLKIIFQNKWGLISLDICELFIPSIFTSLINVHIPLWFWITMFTFVTLYIIFKCKNTQEKASELKYSLFSGIWTVLVLILSVLSFSGITSFVYSRF